MDTFKLINKIELITEENEATHGLIQDIVDDKIYVSVPADDKEFKLLRVGTGITAITYGDDKVISFEAIISKRVLGDLPTYELSNLRNFSKIQRREDVRVESTIPILYTANDFLLKANVEDINSYEKVLNNKKYFKSGWTIDLSGGGIRFSGRKNFDKGRSLLLIFKLRGDPIIAKGTIVYKDIKITDGKTIYIHGVKFTSIAEMKRELIISHNFIIMRKNILR